MSTRSLSVAALLAAGLLALTGCATGSTAPGTSPDAASETAGLDVDAAWLAGGSLIALVTQGSSSCVPIAADATLDDGVLVVTLEDPDAGTPCTRDLVPRATLVGVPEGVDATKKLEIQVSYGDVWGDTDLDAYAGDAVEDFTPSAGWVDDDVFAILTWGSSSCAPQVESVDAEGADVTVTFATPDPATMCTMDMAPRVTLAGVSGADRPATATLTGGFEFAEPVSIPIAG